jgi:hypothetical protein
MTWLMASIAISGVGLVLANYGRKMGRAPHLIAGVVMLAYPYFVPALVPMLIVAAVVCAALWVAVRLGW